MKIAVYPGSFDPITNGHIDVIERASKMFDEVLVVLAINPNKTSTFSIEERLEMMKESLKHVQNVKVDSTDGLTLVYAKEHGACTLIRGLRAVTDFEFEFQIHAANSFIDDQIDTIFLMSRREFNFISSSTIKELYFHHVDISSLVPKVVLKYLKKKENQN